MTPEEAKRKIMEQIREALNDHIELTADTLGEPDDEIYVENHEGVVAFLTVELG